MPQRVRIFPWSHTFHQVKANEHFTMRLMICVCSALILERSCCDVCSGEESLSSRAIGCCEFDCDDYCMYCNDAFLKASNDELKDFSVRRCTGGA
jgi:hypothetical protein